MMTFSLKHKNTKAQINFSRFYLFFLQGWPLYFLHSNVLHAEKSLRLENFVRLSFSSNYVLPIMESRSIDRFKPSFKGDLSLFGFRDVRAFQNVRQLRAFRDSISTNSYQLGGFFYNYYFSPADFFSKLEKVDCFFPSSVLNISVTPFYTFFIMFYKRLYFLLIYHAYSKSTFKKVS